MPDIPHAINIYTDGSFKGRDGGSGFVIRYSDDTEDLIKVDGLEETTNNRSELRACVEALRAIQKNTKSEQSNLVCIHTDSQYIVDNYKNAIWGNWQKKSWKKQDGNDIANKDLWQNLIREFKKTRKRIEVYKVKGHSGNTGNEEADKLAKASRKGVKKQDYGNVKGVVRRWLKIDKKDGVEIDPNSKIILYVQRIKPRIKFFDAHIQVLRPKKYFGVKSIIRGEIENHHFHTGHIHVVKLRRDEHENLIIEEIVQDIGRPSNNQGLLKE